MQNSKYLIIGNGFLGNVLHKTTIRLGINSSITDYKNNGIDIRNISSIEKGIKNIEPNFVINCAAASDVDDLEKNPIRAIDINTKGAQNLALICKEYNIKLIHISTDSVFDGKKGMYLEKDLPNPINEYSKSKKLGEDLIKETLQNSIIIRTNFYGKNQFGKGLFEWIIQKLQNNSEIKGFSDVIFNPLEVNNLSEMILELSQLNYNGIIHLAGSEIFSKYEFAIKIAKNLGYSEKLIKESSIKEANLSAKRPLNTTLSNKMSTKILNTKIIKLEEYLNEFKKLYKNQT